MAASSRGSIALLKIAVRFTGRGRMNCAGVARTGFGACELPEGSLLRGPVSVGATNRKPANRSKKELLTSTPLNEDFRAAGS
jgi:hypothetical protein